MTLLVSSTGEFGDLTLESTLHGVRLAIIKDAETIVGTVLSAESAALLALISNANQLLTKGNTPTTTSVPFSLASVVILAANANRKPCTKIVASLDLDGVAYIALAATATSSLFYEFLEAGDSIEISETAYTGAISMICVGSTAGSLAVTEFVQ